LCSAPEPTDIKFENLQAMAAERTIRRITTLILKVGPCLHHQVQLPDLAVARDINEACNAARYFSLMAWCAVCCILLPFAHLHPTRIK